VNEVTAISAGGRHRRHQRWEADGRLRPAELVLLVRDPGPMVVRNEKGRRALRRRGGGLSPLLAAVTVPG
jgi:hypothetical protein